MKNFREYRKRYKTTIRDAKIFMLSFVINVIAIILLVVSFGVEFIAQNVFYVFVAMALSVFFIEFKKTWIDFKRKRVYLKRQKKEIAKSPLSDVLVFWNGDTRDVANRFTPVERFEFFDDDVFDPIYELKRVAKAKGYKSIVGLTKFKGRVEGFFAKELV